MMKDPTLHKAADSVHQETFSMGKTIGRRGRYQYVLTEVNKNVTCAFQIRNKTNTANLKRLNLEIMIQSLF